MQIYYSIDVCKLRKCVNMRGHCTDTARTLHGRAWTCTDMRVHGTDVHGHCTDTRVHCTDTHVHARRQISTILYMSCPIRRWSLALSLRLTEWCFSFMLTHKIICILDWSHVLRGFYEAIISLAKYSVLDTVFPSLDYEMRRMWKHVAERRDSR